MKAAAVTAVIALGVLYLAFRFHRFLLTTWFLVRLWRWFTGEAHHGKPVTDAGWFRPGVKALTPTGHATRWRHLPRWQRSAHRTGGTVAVTVAVAAVVRWPGRAGVVLAVLAGAGLAGCGWTAWRFHRLRADRRTWQHPLHLAIHDKAGVAKATRAASYIKVITDKTGAVEEARIELPQGWPADEREREWLVRTASVKLGLESPDTGGSKLSGPSPFLKLARSEPPPARVAYEDVAGLVDRAHANELVTGLGRKRAPVVASLSLDSPHFGIAMGTGGGKSNLAAFWLVQELRRGAIAMVLDAKWFSHPWLIKDTEGEYDQLPNIAYLSSPAEMHAGMVWLGAELARRTRVARRAVTASGSLRGDVGPRLIVVAEELNMATPLLKQYWADVRDRDDPKRSPAFAGLGAVAFAGRALKMHMFLIGQMLTADVTGAKDSSVKSNVGVWAMARYGAPGWRTAVGDVPMPPSPDHPGRIQLAVARGVSEVQVPLLDTELARELAMGGVVTPCPAGMPGAVTVSRQRVLAGAPDQSVQAVTVAPETAPAAATGRPVTLAEAVGLGIVHRRTTHAALKMARFRDPDFPADKGLRGTAKVYDPADLAAWDQARRT
jgi:hypothetical protein